MSKAFGKKFLPRYAICIKTEKCFKVCACMRLDSVDENIEGETNFAPPPE